MSGHSKWATIRRSKEANDSKRGQMFTKIGRELVIAVREGGPDPESNFRLRLILDKARRANMPKDNVERAIKRGTGELKGEAALEETTYEGYGPHGTAIMVHTLSDNKNRTVAEIRHAFTRHGGNLGADGCVSWMFTRRGYIAVNPGDNDPDDIALTAIDAGAEDVDVSNDLVEVYTKPEDLKSVQEALAAASYEINSAEHYYSPQSMASLDEKATLQNMKLLEDLEGLEYVQEVFSNLDISDEMAAKYEAEAA